MVALLLTGKCIMLERCFSLEFTNEGKQEYKTHPRAALLGRQGDKI